MLDHWQAAAEEREPVLLASEIAALTLSITTQALFGVDLGEQVNQVGRAVDMGGSLLERPSHPRFKAGLQIVEETVQRIIASSRQSAAAGEQDGNLLNALMQAREADTGLGMDDASLRDQVITLLLAGYETTASALTWTFYLLSQHPEVADRLRQAANSALDGRTPAYADLPALEYAGRVFEESMRLYPPAWVLGRVALADDQLGEYFVPAGTVIAISPYAIHRHPGFWEDPERFDPERFTPEHLARRPYFAYIPFGAGPRYCIGKTLAMLEGQLILPMVIRRFDLRLLPDHEIKPEALFVLRPDRQMKMQLLLPGGNRPAA
jgi:cytochrome P450